MQHKHKSIAFAALSVALIVFGLAAKPSHAAESETYLPDVSGLVGVAGEESVSLSWNPVENADLYTIYYGNSSVNTDGGVYDSQTLTESNSYIVRNLTPEIEYYFAVAAEDSTGVYLGSYSYSNEVAVTPLPVEEIVVIEEADLENEAEEATYEAAEEVETPAEEALPKSGPATNFLFGFSLVAAYLWRKKLCRVKA